jgi:hypothetical protein
MAVGGCMLRRFALLLLARLLVHEKYLHPEPLLVRTVCECVTVCVCECV